MIHIRCATVEDAAALSQLAEKTFRETFGEENTSENLELYVHGAFSPEKQRAEILEPNRHVALACQSGHLVGYYQLLSGSTDPSVTGPNPIELVRLYVDSKWHGQGVAAMLMEDALAHASDSGFETVWLGVWEQNPRALRFYEKWKFERVGSHIFMFGADAQCDLIMVRSI